MKFILDLGNVTVYFKPVEYLTQLGYSGERLEALRRAIFLSHYWLDADAGIVTRDEETEGICADNPDLADDIRAIMKDCDEMLQPIPESVRALNWLTEQGFDCYYLSNTNEPALNYMQSFDYFKLFKGGVASYAERLAKPGRKIFELFSERFGLSPKECVFIDDNSANVEAARACGYNALQLKDPDGLFALVKRLVAEYRA